MSELKNFIEENSMSKFELDEEGKDLVGFTDVVLFNTRERECNMGQSILSGH